MERLPVRRLARINQGMMWIVSGLTAAAMIVAPYLGLDQLIRQLGNTLKTVIRWLLLLIPNSPVEEETMATEQAAAGDAGCRQSGTLVSGTVL